MRDVVRERRASATKNVFSIRIKNAVNAILGAFGLKLARVDAPAVDSTVRNHAVPTVDVAVSQGHNPQYAYSPALKAISMTQLANVLNKVPFYGDKIKFVGLFSYDKPSSKYRIHVSA